MDDGDRMVFVMCEGGQLGCVLPTAGRLMCVVRGECTVFAYMFVLVLVFFSGETDCLCGTGFDQQ